MVGTAAHSDPTVQIPSERLSPECPLFSKADVQTSENGMKLRSAFGHKRSFVAALPCVKEEGY